MGALTSPPFHKLIYYTDIILTGLGGWALWPGYLGENTYVACVEKLPQKVPSHWKFLGFGGPGHVKIPLSRQRASCYVWFLLSLRNLKARGLFGFWQQDNSLGCAVTIYLSAKPILSQFWVGLHNRAKLQWKLFYHLGHKTQKTSWWLKYLWQTGSLWQSSTG